MKIDFICSKQDLSIGTYRILVHDLSKVLIQLGHDVKVYKSVSETRSDSVVIYGKGDVSRRDLNDTRVCGAISLSGDSRQNFDFSIVNSVEEKKSVQHLCKETVVINLVEKMYEGTPLKTHTSTDALVIGYHGSYTHLPKIEIDGFSDAFVDLIRQGKKLRLLCVTNDQGMTEKILRSANIPMQFVENYLWKYETAKNLIARSDIGILPNLTPLKDDTQLLENCDSVRGTYNTDYIYRFKNKSNPGRSFVFIQLGIPVITDLTPSMMPMYYDETCGAVATNKHTWHEALNRFSDSKERDRSARFAYDRFLNLYSMERDAYNLVSAIERIQNGR
jgi:hypothetical protein